MFRENIEYYLSMQQLRKYLSEHKFVAAMVVIAFAFIVISIFNVAIFVPTSKTLSHNMIGGVDYYEYASDLNAPVQNGEEMRDLAADEGSPSDRLIIKTASLVIRVENVEQSVTDIQSLAENLNGFVTNSQIGTRNPITYYETTQPDAPTSATITFRVPSERLDEAITHIKSISNKVFSESVTGQDVTEEYTDLAARLTNLQAAESQLLELYERSGTIEEILKVQQQITNIRGQIEQTQGRIQYLNQSAQLSSVTVSLTEKEIDPMLNHFPFGQIDFH